MLRRFSGLEDVYARTWSEKAIEVHAKNMENETDQQQPGWPDYEDAMGNIINLRYVYDLNVSDVSSCLSP